MTQNSLPQTGPSSSRRSGRRLLAASLSSLTLAVAAALGAVVAGQHDRQATAVETAATTNPVTPGNFTGYAFDQCQAPQQSTMDTWLSRSPYLGVGIYISGDSRGCRVQTYLTPTWVRTQLHNGWKLLPITLGPQASCNPRFPRYTDDVKISSAPGADGTFPTARTQGANEAAKTLHQAQVLGIVPGSTMYYDIEAFDTTKYRCRASTLSFLSGWTVAIHKAGYVSGVYSSASSGIAALDSARARKQAGVTLPDQIWIADWDGKANTTSSYVSSTGWQPHRRVKQFQGGHNETYGGVTINIDRDFVDVGRGTYAPKVAHCGGVNLDLPQFPIFKLSSDPANAARIKAIKCMLREQGLFTTGTMDGAYGPHITLAVHQWKTMHHFKVSDTWYREDWISLLTAGQSRIVKFGSGNEAVRAVQRALNAVDPTLQLPITGDFGADTAAAVRAYQTSLKQRGNAIVDATTWAQLHAGRV